MNVEAADEMGHPRSPLAEGHMNAHKAARPIFETLPSAPVLKCMFGKLKDWRRIAARHHRRAHTFFPAIRWADTVIFYLKQ